MKGGPSPGASRTVPAADSPSAGLGVAMALASAASFGVITTMAKLTYDGGGNAITFALVRAALAALVMLALIPLMRRAWRVPRAGWADTLWVALGQTGMSVFYMGAVQYVSVSLGAILFYTYPIVVLIVESLARRERPGPVRVTAFALAFAGLVLAIGPSFEGVDWRGLAFAGGAVASATLLFMTTGRARRHVNEIALTFWANGLGLPVMLALMPAMGGFSLPETPPGWTGLSTACVLFALAFVTYVVSLRHINASRAAMIYNLEPIVSLATAALVLGETLPPARMAGGLLVIAAVMLAAWRRQQRAVDAGRPLQKP